MVTNQVPLVTPLQVVQDRFRIVRFLGKGGAGTVYEATDLKLRRRVALKFLLGPLAHGATSRERYKREVRALSKLSHPHICTLYDIDVYRGIDYLIMEYVDGETLGKRLRRGALLPDLVLCYALELIDALDAAHRHGVIHRDFKPANILLTEEGTKLVDFGLAKLHPVRRRPGSVTTRTVTRSLTTAGTIMGTTPYIAPEHLKAARVDHRADIFSFGCVLYEMLTGQHAFQGNTPPEIMGAILKDDPLLDGNARPTVPTRFAYIIKRCLEKDPAQRFNSSADVRDALQTLSGIPAVLPPAGPPPAAGLQQTVQRHANIDLDASITFQRITFGQGAVHRARFTANETSVIYTGESAGNGGGIYWRDLANLNVRPLPFPAEMSMASVSRHDELALLHAPWSPMGMKLSRSNSSGQPIRHVLDGVLDADWSPDGSALAVIRRLSHTSCLEFPIGSVLYEKEAPPTAAMYGLRVSPDGNQFACFEYLNGDCVLTVVDRIGHRRVLHNVAKGGTAFWELSWSPDGKEIWFSSPANQTPGPIYAVSTAGQHRIVSSVPGECILTDVARDGRMLLNAGKSKLGIGYTRSGTEDHVDLSFQDASWLCGLSNDGKTILMTDLTSGPAHDKTILLGRIGGPPPLSIGYGFARSLSHDAQWILASRTSPGSVRVLIPADNGPEHVARLQGHIIAFYPLQNRYLVWRSKTGQEGEFVLQHASRGAGKPVPDPRTWLRRARKQVLFEHTAGGVIMSPDQQRFVAADTNGQWHVYKFVRGRPARLFTLAADELPVNWCGNQPVLFVTSRIAGASLDIYKLNLKTRHKRLWQTITPQQPAGIYNLRITPNGRHCAYSYNQRSSDLYIASHPATIQA
jgi:serine/threonine protein kinase